MKGLIIYPNFSYDNPNQIQLNRLISGLGDKCEIHVLARKGPRTPSTLAKVFYIPKENFFRVHFQRVLQKICPSLAYPPDELRFVINHSLKRTGKRLVQKEHYDFIASLSFPLSAQLVGQYISKKFNLPWISIFYDPWTDNLYRHQTKNFMKKLDAYYEKMVANKADAIIHTNKYIASIWEKRYGSDVNNKIHILPFCYSKNMTENVSSPQKEHKERIVISYIGNRFAQRDLKDVITATKQLRDSGLKEIERLQFCIIGKPYEPDEALVKKYNLSSLFVFHDAISGDALNDYYNSSDFFLVIDAAAERNIFFPSKLMDYFYFRKPIIGITPSAGVTSDLLRDSGNIAIPSGDIETLTEIIKQISLQGRDFVYNDLDYWKKFRPENICPIFIDIVNAVCSIKQKV